jgi:hypothetical protein
MNLIASVIAGTTGVFATNKKSFNLELDLKATKPKAIAPGPTKIVFVCLLCKVFGYPYVISK